MNDVKSAPAREGHPRMVRVWDPLVRIGHWALLAAFVIAYLSEDEFLTVHVWAGYTVAVIVVVRVLWGFVGPQHARFVDFVRSPGVTLRYLGSLSRGRARRYLGHNPAGAAMVLALLLGLAGTTVSGLMLYAIEEHAGPLAGWVAADTPAEIVHSDSDHVDSEGKHEDREEFWEEVHEIFVNATLLLVVVHVLGVLYSSYLHRENLPRAMVTGRKRRE